MVIRLVTGRQRYGRKATIWCLSVRLSVCLSHLFSKVNAVYDYLAVARRSHHTSEGQDNYCERLKIVSRLVTKSTTEKCITITSASALAVGVSGVIMFPCSSLYFRAPILSLLLDLLLTYFQNFLGFILHKRATAFCSFCKTSRSKIIRFDR